MGTDLANQTTLLLPHMLYLAVGVFLLSLLLTRLMIRVNIADVPNDRSSHDRPTPKSGGLSIAVTFCGGLLAAAFLWGLPRLDLAGLTLFAGLAAAVALLSLFDDIYDLRPVTKLAIQVAAAAAFSLMVDHVDRLWLPGLEMLEFGVFGHWLTILWIVGFMNAFNCLDGVHGLASGGALVASAALGLIAFFTGANFLLIACALLFAATLGFFLFNFPHGRVFLGDTGSQFLGFVFAALAVLGASAAPERISFYVVPLLFYSFIFDFTVTLALRLAQGKELFKAHREHLFQLCHRLGLSPVRICALHFGFFLLNAGVAVWAQWGDPWLRLFLVLGLLPLHGAYAWAVYRAARQRGL